MSEGYKRDEKGEKLRVCPSCRMQISVLATKCRYCGEEVGKPKEETRTLSVHDLGGENVLHRAPSGSVMEALESFRVEETFSSSEGPGLGGSSLDLDFGGDSGGKSSSTSAFANPSASSPSRPAKSKLPLIGGIVVAIVVVAVLAVAVPKFIDSFGDTQADASLPTYINRAPGILNDGGPAIDALQAAVEAIGHEDSEKNHRIAEDAVAALDKEVRALLAKKPFDMQNIRDASSLASRGVDLYPNNVTQDLVDEVNEDNRAYKISLARFDREADSATLIDNAGNRLTVKQGDKLLNRFLVERLHVGYKRVILKDTRRGDRLVVFEPGMDPRAPG
jgi:hypothetical protein